MQESRRVIARLLFAMAAPLFVLVMVPLALLFALGYYLFSVLSGFWFLCRGVPGWVLALNPRQPVKKPHFLQVDSLDASDAEMQRRFKECEQDPSARAPRSQIKHQK